MTEWYYDTDNIRDLWEWMEVRGEFAPGESDLVLASPWHWEHAWERFQAARLALCNGEDGQNVVRR